MNLQLLNSDNREAIVDVLVRAFHDYPAMRYFLKVRGDEYRDQLRVLNAYYTDARLLRGWPVIGVMVGRDLSAVALVSPPLDSPPESLPELVANVRSAVGESAWKRMKEFDRLCDSTLPQAPHHFLGMLAVHPKHQSSGQGTKLLDRVKEMSVSEQSRGVTLTTETEKNVDYYTRLGFDVVGETDFGTLTSWIMRWANPEFQDQAAE